MLSFNSNDISVSNEQINAAFNHSSYGASVSGASLAAMVQEQAARNRSGDLEPHLQRVAFRAPIHQNGHFNARFYFNGVVLLKMLTPLKILDIVSFFRRGVEQHGSSSGS